MTQSDYDNLNPKNTGRIYFTSDTHRIYKGSDLYAATTFDQLNFSAIEASSITVDGSAVSLEGHSHAMSEVEGLDAALSGFASSGHTHNELSGITSTSISKANASFASVSANTGTFDNLVVANASVTATSIVASGV